MKKAIKNNYMEAIKAIKTAILKSRYRAVALANQELLSLYYGIGKYVSENSRNGVWGTSAIETISERLQQELPGLRGFSAGNIKKMRIFYEQWYESLENRALPAHDLETLEKQDIEICALSTHDIKKMPFGFIGIGFTHHYEIIKKTTSNEERLFYIERCATEFWSVDKLKYNLKSNLYKKQGKIQSNFKATIPDNNLQRKALMSFKDEYLLDFINIESPDDEPERECLKVKSLIIFENSSCHSGKTFHSLAANTD